MIFLPDTNDYGNITFKNLEKYTWYKSDITATIIIRTIINIRKLPQLGSFAKIDINHNAKKIKMFIYIAGSNKSGSNAVIITVATKSPIITSIFINVRML